MGKREVNVVAAKLTPRQKAFAEFYIQLGNATEAAKRAGYSEKTANRIGAENLTKPVIREYVDKVQSEISSSRIADAREVQETLTRILRREETESVVIVCKTRKSSYDKAGKRKTEEKETPEIVRIPAKISDVNKAAELLGKVHGLYTDKVDLSGGVDLRIQVDYGNDQGSSE
ncbi:terminase [Christensenella minuta]|nr:terminase small subunit [Christensenella minuta]AYH41308.1 terminase small subunit [Christensenella minuta]AYH41343.1 terminase small subunit [Christensenella minuta]OAQ39363.1 terminase [Christensenella minuta]